jgi:ABC-type sugar transport system ATPase subunit
LAVVCHQLSKSFAGVPVLRGVNLTLKAGEVHALLGANGSGKSTLVKILTGVYQPDSGSITVGGQTLSAFTSPHDAGGSGIAVVHQEAPLIDTMTVAQCIGVFRGFSTSALGRVDWARLERETKALLDRYEVQVSPRQLAGTLSPAERALVALVIALDRVRNGVELLILDEVTASLPEDQAEVFLRQVGAVAKDGVAVLMVTHRLTELKNLARSVTVLREGGVVHSAPAGETTDEQLVARMVGVGKTESRVKDGSSGSAVRKLWSAEKKSRRSPPIGDDVPALALEGVAGTFLRDVHLEVRPGEIVGVAGLVDAGIAELPQILGGLVSRRGGNIRVSGASMSLRMRPAEAIEAGLAVLPGDRLRNGGIATLSVSDNVILPEVGRFWGRRRLKAEVLRNVISVLDVRPPSARILFSKLSGGNQQKSLLGKWLLTRPTVLVLDDPTSGVDPGAREKIFEILHDAAREGLAILLFSTEPEQLASICGRVLILRQGRIVTELTGQTLSRETISRWCYA